MPFKLTGYCRRKIQAKKEKNAKCMALQCQMESSQQRQTRLQDISAHKAIHSQLETFEKRKDRLQKLSESQAARLHSEM